MHVDETCENQSCEIVKCQSRHPKHCRYFRDFGRCKFNPCKSNQIIFDVENDAIKGIERKHEEINTKLIAIDEKLKQLDFQEKLLEIEEKVETQRLAKDNIIEELTVQIKGMNGTIANLAETLL